MARAARRRAMASCRALIALLVAAMQSTSTEAACARVNNEQSSGWLDRDGVTKRFSLQLTVVHWVAFAEISLSWPDAEAVTVEHVWNADQMHTSAAASASTVVLRLGRTPGSTPVIMGQGTVDTSPAIACSTSSAQAVPPPSPPHASACPLGPTYETLHSWDSGDNVQITFQDWRDAGLVRLKYWGQTGLQVEGLVGATVSGTTPINGDTLIVLQLGTSCEDRVVDSQGVVVSQPGQQMNCVPHRAATMHVTFNLKPPALHNPQISCREGFEPPPPPPRSNQAPRSAPLDSLDGGWAPIFHPPSPPSPHPPPALTVGTVLRSGPQCSMGATLRVAALTRGDGKERARIEIAPRAWSEGATVLLGVSGSQFDVPRDGSEQPVRAAFACEAIAARIPTFSLSCARGTRMFARSRSQVYAIPQRPTVDATGQLVVFAFKLSARPSGRLSMAFTLVGKNLHLSTLSCR